MTPRERFEKVIGEAVRDPASVSASLELADSVAKHFAMLIERYLEAYRSPSIPPRLASFYANVSPNMLMYGLFTHFICFGSHHRGKFQHLDEGHLYELWEEEAATALSTLDAYSKGNRGLPDAFFRALYAIEAEPIVRESGGWWWKRARIQGAIRDRFATGVVLGMAVDMATAKI